MRTSNGLTWNTVTLGKDKLLERTLFHRNKAVDIAIIRISDVISEFLVKSSESNYYLNDFGVTSRMLPGGDNVIQTQVSDDVLVVGYPNQFYDEVNLFPIVKSGIVASSFGKNFGNEPCFLIDAKLMPEFSDIKANRLNTSRRTPYVQQRKAICISRSVFITFAG
jgi:hypothetical protein